MQNVNEAPIDNISAIEALRAIGKANNGKLPLDLTERCVKVELVEEDPASSTPTSMQTPGTPRASTSLWSTACSSASAMARSVRKPR